MAISSWHTDWVPLPGHAVADRDGQQVAVVARAPTALDLFVLGTDNQVWSTFWTDADGWAHDWFPLPGRAVFNHEKQQVAAISRAPGCLDLFVIGDDNCVWSTFWTDLYGWHPDWFPLPGQARFDHLHQRIAAISRAHGNLDLFLIGFDNRVWTTFWNTAHGWHGDWFPLPGAARFDHNRQQITAVSRAPGSLDLFVLGFDDRPWTTFWSDATGWNSDWFPLPGHATFDSDSQQIAAVARSPANLDLFVIGPDQRCWSTFWSAAGNWSGDWFPVPGLAIFDRQRQNVQAVSRSSGNLDLFVLGFDHRGWTTSWSHANGWRHEWVHVPGHASFDPGRRQIAAIARKPSHLDLFVIGDDGHVWSTFWGLHDAHPAIRLRAVAAQGRYVEVAGEGFTPNQPVRVGYDIYAGGVPITHQLGEDTLTSDASGKFIDRIPVNLGGVFKGAQAQATDVASNAVAMASM